MPTVVVGASLAVYAAALFAVGWLAHRSKNSGLAVPLVTALSIGVYCTSWTFYGAVGTASRSGWDYLPIYLGPILAFTLGLSLILRTVRLGKGHGATSLPDLLSRRFGRSPRLAMLATLTLVVVSIPYIALQLLAVSSTFAAVTGTDELRSAPLILATGAILTLFALVFGIRQRDGAGANPGLVNAIAFDSVFKLVAFLAVVVLAFGVLNDVQPTSVSVPAIGSGATPDRFIVLTGLSAFMMLCLPRQFQMTVVEPPGTDAVRRAAPIVVGYFALFASLVLPLVAAGNVLDLQERPDLLVLQLPVAMGLDSLAVLAFAGGFAAAAGMVIVSGVALSTMISSDVVLPILSRQGGQGAFQYVLRARRLSLIVLVSVAASFALLIPQGAPLADLGVVSFAGAGQLMPLLLAALFWGRVTEHAAFFGLVAGLTSWFVFVLGPAFFPLAIWDLSGVAETTLPFLSDDFTRGTIISLLLNGLVMTAVTLFASSPLKAKEDAARFAAIGGDTLMDGEVTRSELYALLAPILDEADLRTLFDRSSDDPHGRYASPALLAAAEARLSRVLGNASAHILLRQLGSAKRIDRSDVMILVGEASRGLRFSQELLATTLDNLAEGVSVIDHQGQIVAWNQSYADLFAYPEGLLEVGTDVLDLLRFNRPDLAESKLARRKTLLLEGKPHTSEICVRDGRIVRLQGRPVPGGGYVTSFSDVTEYREAQAALTDSEAATRFYTDNIPFPIAFADGDEVIQFHNRAYAAMVGQREADLTGLSLFDVLQEDYVLRTPAIEAVLSGYDQRFVLGPQDIGGDVTWQVTYVAQNGANGQTSGFFGFYQDISQRRAAQAALEEANRTLEARVATRTSELQSANEAADAARRDAETANRSKTKFLAAASHDVLQPLNAARLFASNLEDSLPAEGETREVASKISAAIVSADTLLRSLLNLSKLEAGGVDPRNESLRLGPFLRGIVEEFAPFAREKGLRLRAVPTTFATNTDPGLLRSAIQNLVSNALRYTDTGGVLLGVRRFGDGLAIDVIDTGRGISEEQIPKVFKEFARLERDQDVEGAGLGLATVRRVAALLEHEVEVTSTVGRGTRFRVLVRKTEAPKELPRARSSSAPSLEGRRIICVDNDPQVLDALKSRFDRWGASTSAYFGLTDIRRAFEQDHDDPDLLILDHQLDAGTTGLDVLDFVRKQRGIDCPAIFVTANQGQEDEEQLRATGSPVLAKPVEPAALRALSISLLSTKR